jgi:small subunit ribosomal protein S1
MSKSKDIVEKDPKSKMASLLEKEEYSPRTLIRGQIVEGKVVSKSKDQLFIDVGAKSEGVISAKDLEGEEKFGDIKVGDKILTYVMIPESEGGQVILSMKKAGSERRWQEISKMMDTDKTVVVKPLESNRGGLLVDYEGIRGFIPSSHLVSQVKGTGGLLKVKVLEVDKRLNRLIFSEKEASPELAKTPKMDLPFSVGDEVEGEVSKILPFGVLVNIKGGPEGLVHISEISWERVENIDKMFKVGDKVKVKVIEIDQASVKVNLSIKRLTEDPWKKAESKYPVGKKFKAEISRTSSYGAFVQLEKGIEGLIHSSKIPYGNKLQPGDKVSVSIDLFSPDQRRVALRLEQEEGKKEAKGEVKGQKAKVKSKKSK